MDTLTGLSEQGECLVGNQAMRVELNWEEHKYFRMRDQLARDGLLMTGRGRGGSVGLTDVPGNPVPKLFISYTHGDEQAKDELLKHLEPLKRMKLIEAWHDREIQPGDDWDENINEHLENADIILLIVSIDFINSAYCYDVEMELAMERHEEGTARVIPIIYRNCMWKHAPFADLLALPRDAKPINSWGSLDDAYVDIAEGIKKVAEEMLASK